MADAVSYIEVWIVVHMIQLIGEREHGVEIVVGPIEALAKTHADAYHLEVFARIVRPLEDAIVVVIVTPVDAIVVVRVG